MWKDTRKLQCWKIIVSSANMKFIKLVLTEMLLYMISRLYLLYICSGKPCCQTAPRHYLVQCYLTLNKNQLILCSGGNVIEIVSRILVIFFRPRCVKCVLTHTFNFNQRLCRCKPNHWHQYVQEDWFSDMVKYILHRWYLRDAVKQNSAIIGPHQGPLLLTWFNFNPSMDK